MLEYCRRMYPGGTFELLDLRDVSSVEGGPFDAVLAGANLIDVLDDAERLRVLRSLAELLVPDGLVILSSHNRAFAPSVPGPLRAALRGGTLSEARRLPWWLMNRLRLRRHLRDEDDYAIVNDEAHDFRLLHYYISRDAQERQFEAAGLALVECLDLNGRPVERGELAEPSSSLHYVARRSRARRRARASPRPTPAARSATIGPGSNARRRASLNDSTLQPSTIALQRRRRRRARPSPSSQSTCEAQISNAEPAMRTVANA